MTDTIALTLKRSIVLVGAVLALALVAPSRAHATPRPGLGASRTKNFIFVWCNDTEGKKRFEIVFSREAAGIGGVFDSTNDPKHDRNLAAKVFDHDTALVAFEFENRSPAEWASYYPAAPRIVKNKKPRPGKIVTVEEARQKGRGLTDDEARQKAREVAKEEDLGNIPEQAFPRPNILDPPEADFPDHAFKLEEDTPQRVTVVIAGNYAEGGDPNEILRPLKYETAYTVYPSGRIFIRHTIDYRGPRFALGKHIIGFSAAGVDDYECIGSEPIDPKRLDYATTDFVLFEADTPRYRTDLLLVPAKTECPVARWAEFFASARQKELYFRSRLVMPRDDNGFGPSRTWWNMMVDIGRRDLGKDEAATMAGEYRNPSALEFLPGWGGIDTLAGGADDKGFDPSRGVYRLQAGQDGVAFYMDGGKYPRRQPAFEIAGWSDRVPKTIEVARIDQTLGEDYYARLIRIEPEEKPDDPLQILRPDYRLLVQFMKPVMDDDVRFVIRK